MSSGSDAVRPVGAGVMLALAYLGFVSLGLPDAALGVAWPSMRDGFGLPQAGLGLVLAATGGGFFVSSALAGTVLRRVGVGTLLGGSTALVALALLGYAAAPSWWVLLLCAPLLGLGSGAIDAGLNAYAAENFSARHMNWLHAAYGLGAGLGPFVMTAALAGVSWQFGYGVLGVVLGGMALLFLASRNLWHARTEPAEEVGGPRVSGLAALRIPLVRLQILAFFLYVGVEVSAGQWAFTVLHEARGYSVEAAGFWAGAFWLALFLGRLAVGAVGDRVTPDALTRGGAAGSALGSVVFAFAPGDLADLGLLVMGFALAPIYPMLMLRTPMRLGVSVGRHAVGFQVSAAMLGGITMPALAGGLAQAAGTEAITVFLVVVAAAVLGTIELVLRSRSSP